MAKPIFFPCSCSEAHPGNAFICMVTAQDPDGGSISYSKVGSDPTWLSVTTVGNDAELSGTPGWSDVSSTYVTIRATDSQGETEDLQCLIHVTNHAPIISIPTEIEFHPGRQVMFHINANDSDGDSITLDVTDGPGTITGNEYSWMPNWSDPPTQFLTIRACDGEPKCATATCLLKRVNLPPELVAIESPQDAIKDEEFTVQIMATDPDPEDLANLNYQVLQPPGASITPDGLFRWTPTKTGDYPATVKACDPEPLCDQISFIIHVEKP